MPRFSEFACVVVCSVVRTAGAIRVCARHGRRLALGLTIATVVFAAVSASTHEAVSAGNGGSKRPLRLDDLFDSERFLGVAFSPDGGAVAFVRRRADSSQLVNGMEAPEVRDDIWLQSVPGKEPKNLTNGAKDSSGAWAPKWAPDGQYLTFLSSRGGNVTPWVWERGTSSIRQLSKAGIEFRGSSGGCRWVADRRMLCLAVAAGRRSTPTRGAGQAVEYHEAMWQKVRGGELAVAPFDSVEFRPATRRLVLFDVGKGTEQEVATILFEEYLETWWASPDGSTVAFLREASFSYSFYDRVRLGYPASIDLRRLDGRSLKLPGTMPINILASSLSWRPDSQSVAFFALGSAKISPVVLYGEELSKAVQHDPVASPDNPAKLWELDLRRGQVAEINTGDVDLGREPRPPAFQWLASGEWLFWARRLSDRAQPHKETKPEWLVLSRHGAIRTLLRESRVSIAALKSVDGGRTFLSLTQGDLWKVDLATGMARNLTDSFGPPVLLYTLPDNGERTSVVVKAGEPKEDIDRWYARYKPTDHIQGTDDYILDLRSGSLTRIDKPAPTALIQAVHGPTRALVYKFDGNTGTRLWRGSEGQSAVNWEPLATANEYYQNIATYQERLLEYTTANGEKVLAKVTFPLDYVPGRKYPVVVDSDIDYQPSTTPQLFTLSRPNSSPVVPHPTAKVFASLGYVYMFTSAPTARILDQSGRGNLLLLTNGVLPAVDAAVAAGFADPNRFVLYGMSSFGYGVLGLVTQTARFKAAVAQSSWSDQSTSGLTLSDVERYSDNSFERVSGKPPYSSTDLPFWRFGEIYRRNSPLTYVDRVRTPTLIIQHEFDFLPMSQVEMFFSALVVQRKPARFLRYFGEQHVLSMPANVRDCYRQIFAWFDQYADIERDQVGQIVFDGDRAKSREGRPALMPEDFTRFGPAAVGAFQQIVQD